MSNSVKLSDISKKEYYTLRDPAGKIIKIIFPNTTQFGISESVESEVIVASNLVPDQDSVRSLGAIDNQWKDLYVSSGTIYLGGASISLTDAGKVQIKDKDAIAGTVLSDITAGGVTEESVISALGYTPANNTLDNIDAETGRLKLQISNYVTGSLSELLDNIKLPTIISGLGYTPIRTDFANIVPSEARSALGIQSHVTGTLNTIFDNLSAEKINLKLGYTPVDPANPPSNMLNSNITFTKGANGSIILNNGSEVTVTISKSDIGLGNVVNKSALELASDAAFTTSFRASSWLPTAGEVGAREATWTPDIDDLPGTIYHDGRKPTKSDVGLGNVVDKSPSQLAALADFTDNFRSSNWTPTASEVGAREATWTPGISDLPGTIYHTGNKPSKSDVGLGNVEDKTPAQLAALSAFTSNFRASSWTPGINDLPGTIYHDGRKPNKGDVGLGNVVDKSPSDLAVDAAFTSNTFRNNIHAHFKTNDSDWNTRGVKITATENTLSEHSGKFNILQTRGRSTGKSKMGVLDNGKMLITEDFVDASGNTIIQPAGWVTSRGAINYSGLGYEDSTNKVAKLSLSNSDSAIGILSPAFELKEDRYKIKVRMKSDIAHESYPMLYVWYTTDDELKGEYVTNQTIYPSESRHATNIAFLYRVISGNTGNSQNLTKVSSNTQAGASFEVHEYDLVVPSGAKWASIELYKSDPGTLYIDWISVSEDTKTLRPTADSLNLSNFVGQNFPTATSLGVGDFENKTLESAFNQGRSSANSTYSASSKRNLYRNISISDYGDFAVNQDWQIRSSPRFIYSGTNTAKLRFMEKTGAGVWTSRGYINEGGTDSTINFTGQHRCESKNNELTIESTGLIVVSSGRYNNLIENDVPTINSALPIVELSSKRYQKNTFGVISDKEDLENFGRCYSFGNFVSESDYEGDTDRLIINSLGEGAIWVTNINGNLENGDYITTCEIPGYGMKQDDDLLHNYTVAKITQNCDFDLNSSNYTCEEIEYNGQTYRRAFVGCTYHCG